MSRTHDLVLARLRLLTMRWRGESGLPSPGPGVARSARDPSDGSADPGRPVAVGSTRAAGEDPTEPTDRRQHDEGSEVPEQSECVEGSAQSERIRAQVWLALLAVMVVVALTVGAGLLARSWPRPVPTALPDPGDSSSALVRASDPFAPASPTPSASLVVHVVGEVRRPGVVQLAAGSRVADALEAAGGLRRGGRLGATNLARVLSDGERIEIGADADDGSSSGGAGDPGGATGPVDLNTATAAQLDGLPGIGPITAAKILAWRGAHGRFTVVDELAEVPGIGPKTLEELRAHVRV